MLEKFHLIWYIIYFQHLGKNIWLKSMDHIQKEDMEIGEGLGKKKEVNERMEWWLKSTKLNCKTSVFLG